MTIEIIDVGFGRTGTMSLKLALEQLGFGPCHHMEEVLTDPEQARFWASAAAGERSDWDTPFEGYRSTVDWPTTRFWRDIVDHYPNAKVILTKRDPDRWYDSISGTIHKVLEGRVMIDSPMLRNVMDMAYRIISEETFDGRLGDPEHAKSVFNRHNADVIEAIPPERLLVFEVAEGWGPLCDYLGCPVPDGPFPRVNSTKEFWELIESASGS